jgi:hypothetical protein
VKSLRKFKQLANLGGLRLLSLSLTLGQSILIVRFLTLEEIGWYYLVAMVAYIGNAAIFVGSDFYLQRQLPRLSVDQPLRGGALASYIILTGTVGGALVIGASSMYFSITAPAAWLMTSLVCASLSVATYLSTLGRNLCQLANFPVYSSLGQVVEGTFKVALLVLLAFVGLAEALPVAVLATFGALMSAVITFGLLMWKMHSHYAADYSAAPAPSYLSNKRELSGVVLSVGAGGVLNWAQLQGYRPFLMASSAAGGAVVGSISLLSTLGSTAANAAFNILTQLQLPKQYQSKGGSTARYLALMGLLALFLSIVSLPAGALFLWLADKMELIGLVYLVAVGVLVEAGNAAIGICTHHLNTQKKNLHLLPLAGLIGCLVTFALLLVLPGSQTHMVVALALVAGQISALSSVLYFTFHVHKDQ